MKTVIILTVF